VTQGIGARSISDQMIDRNASLGVAIADVPEVSGSCMNHEDVDCCEEQLKSDVHIMTPDASMATDHGMSMRR